MYVWIAGRGIFGVEKRKERNRITLGVKRSINMNIDNSVEMTALSLLEYGLDQPERGINCRCKAQILNEMLLALGVYSRKVWIMPESIYDDECHVVNEVWDASILW